MDNLNTVILGYNLENRIKYQRYAEFLRLAGIYVDERCISSEEEKEALRSEQLDEETLLYIVGTASEEDDVLDILEQIFSDCREDLENTDFTACFEQLKKVFVEKELLQASVTLQFFRKNDILVQQAGKRFVDAAYVLGYLMETAEELYQNRHMRYARIYCWQKANLAACLCQQPMEYYVDILGEECLELINDFPDFSNAWALLGLIYEFVKSRVKDSLSAFDKAVSMIGEKPYASSIYYWMGKRCEGHMTLNWKLESSYRRAYELCPKYRNIFKMCIISEAQQNWNEAIKYLQLCIQYLKQKKGYLDPLEQEYYYKVQARIGFTYIYRIEDAIKGIPYIVEALDFRKKIEENKKQDTEYTWFYYEMYGEEAEKYIDLELTRMEATQAYKYLIKAYEELNMFEEAEEYKVLIG